MSVTRLPLLLPIAWALACSPGAAPTSPSSATSLGQVSTRVSDREFPLYGLGHRAVLPGCGAKAFRAFDFWLGDWNVYSAGDLVGTNIVTSEYKNCAIEEHWTDGAGGRGRSLNTYDAGNGTWNQLWMDATGLALILSGESSPRQISMSGDTPQFINGPIISNRITWSRLSSREVRQFWEVSQDGRTTWNGVFDGSYRKERKVTPVAEAPNQFCESLSRPRYHWFDFIVGEWSIRESAEGGRTLGRLSVQKDLGGCLLEWKFDGALGNDGTAFAAFHFPTLTWHRTWIDQSGMRIAMTGQLQGSSMVFTGTRVVKRGRNQDVRATWTPVDQSTVSEKWETSDDAGTTWAPALDLVLTRN